MEKRLILAIALSLLVLLIWSTLVSKVYHIENEEVTIIQPPPSPVIKQEPAVYSLFNYSQEKVEINFIESQAAIKDVKFKAYQDYLFPLKQGFFLADKAFVFQKESIYPEAVTFVHSDQNKKIIKKFIFSKPNYTIDLDIIIQNLSNASLKIELPLVLGWLDFSSKDIQTRYKDVAVVTKDRKFHFNAQKNMEFKAVKFLGLRDRYFCAIIEPEQANYLGFVHKLNSNESEVGLIAKDITLQPKQHILRKFRIYLGPQDLRLINRIKPDWSAIVYYGTFDFISQILLQILEFLYSLVHNWGWAIVILSLLVYIFLYPLTLKQMRSIKEMQTLQPQVENLRKIYKDNPQKLNKEMMELYRQHKVNPFGGCLPMLLQLPIFIALYQALMRSITLRGARFLWIRDLSLPDRLFVLPVSLPIIGNEINILPIIMTLGMFIQQKISTTTTSTASSEQQKIMMIVFPFMFGLIFYHMPSGLVLYWFVNSTIMLLYQWRVSRVK